MESIGADFDSFLQEKLVKTLDISKEHRNRDEVGSEDF